MRHELEKLLEETNSLLACPDFEPSAWEAYGVRRAEIFARLQGLPVPTNEAERAAITTLVQEILAQDTTLIHNAQTRMASLQTELASLSISRRALHGYASLPPAILFQSEA